MSVRIWLKKDGDLEIARLAQTGVLRNLKVKEHQATGKKYVKLGVGLTDPTEEVPQIPQEIVERVTFKGKVYLLGDYPQHKLPVGSFHSMDMATHLLILTSKKIICAPAGKDNLCEISITAPSILAAQEMLYRLSTSELLYKSLSLISKDEEREEDKGRGQGAFKALSCFLPK